MARLYELREEVKTFLNQGNSGFAELIADMKWCSKLAYLDVFKHLNDLNAKMQGKAANILTSISKLRGFRSKLTFWCSFVEQGQLEMFPLCNAHSNSKLNSLMPSLTGSLILGDHQDWKVQKGMPLQIQEQLMELREDCHLKMKFQDMASSSFWIIVEKDYPAVASSAIAVLMPFYTTYLC